MHFHKPKKIHWGKFVNRKMIAIGVAVLVARLIGDHLHVHLLSRGGEMLMGVTMEHLIFGVPFEDV